MASVGAVPDESTVDDGECECFVAEESQIDGRRGWRVTIRNVDVECVRDRMMSLKQRKFYKFQSITKNMPEIKIVHLVNNPFFDSRLKSFNISHKFSTYFNVISAAKEGKK